MIHKYPICISEYTFIKSPFIVNVYEDYNFGSKWIFCDPPSSIGAIYRIRVIPKRANRSLDFKKGECNE